MQNLLFDDTPTPLGTSPAQEQRQAKKREVDACRQRRHRAKKRDAKPKGVTALAKVVTLFATESRLGEEQSRPSEKPTEPIGPELRLLLDAFGQIAAEGTEVDRPAILRALTAQARVARLDIFNAEGFLESAFERGVVPQFEGTKWVSVPRELLEVLVAELETDSGHSS